MRVASPLTNQRVTTFSLAKRHRHRPIPEYVAKAEIGTVLEILSSHIPYFLHNAPPHTHMSNKDDAENCLH